MGSWSQFVPDVKKNQVKGGDKAEPPKGWPWSCVEEQWGEARRAAQTRQAGDGGFSPL